MGDNCDRSPRRRGHNVSHHARVEQTDFLLHLTLHWPAPAKRQVPLPPRPLRISSFCSSNDAGPHTTTARYSRRTARACGCGSVPTGRRSACRLRNGLREPKAVCSCLGLRRLKSREVFGDVVPGTHALSGFLKPLLHHMEKRQTLQVQIQSLAKQVHGVWVLIVWHGWVSPIRGAAERFKRGSPAAARYALTGLPGGSDRDLEPGGFGLRFPHTGQQASSGGDVPASPQVEPNNLPRFFACHSGFMFVPAFWRRCMVCIQNYARPRRPASLDKGLRGRDGLPEVGVVDGTGMQAAGTWPGCRGTRPAWLTGCVNWDGMTRQCGSRTVRAAIRRR